MFMTIMCLKCAFIHVRALIGTSSWWPVPCAKGSNEVKGAPGRSKRIRVKIPEVTLSRTKFSDAARALHVGWNSHQDLVDPRKHSETSSSGAKDFGSALTARRRAQQALRTSCETCDTSSAGGISDNRHRARILVFFYSVLA